MGQSAPEAYEFQLVGRARASGGFRAVGKSRAVVRLLLVWLGGVGFVCHSLHWCINLYAEYSGFRLTESHVTESAAVESLLVRTESFFKMCRLIE